MPSTNVSDQLQSGSSIDTAVSSERRSQGMLRRYPFLTWLTPAVLATLLVVQFILLVPRVSQTADESTHLYAGYRVLKCSDYGFSPEHPPLAKVVAALPFLWRGSTSGCTPSQPNEAYASLDWLYAQDWRTALFSARFLTAIFAAALCLAIWIAARRMFDFTTAAVAVVLFVLEPNVLAHGALVTTDMAVTSTFFVSVLLFYLWTTRRSFLYLLLCGVVAGLTLTAKHSGVVVLPVLGLLAVTDAFLSRDSARPIRRTLLRNVFAFVLVSALAYGALWAVYGFRFAARPDGKPLPVIGSGRGSLSSVLVQARAHHLVPEAYVEGLQRARILARVQTRPAMLLGQFYQKGPWYFFPVTFLIKFTVALLVLLLVAVFRARSLLNKHKREVLFLAGPALAFLAGCMSARMYSGIRHALPILPFLLILVAAGCVDFARRYRQATVVVAFLLTAHLASSLHTFPDYLSYANELWGGPRNAYKVLPNNDWGQALFEVKSYVEKQGKPCWFATPYLIDIKPYNIPCTQFWGGKPEPIPQRVNGIVLLSNIWISDGTVDWLAPFNRLEPTDRLGGSAVLAYEGEFDTRLASGESNSLVAYYAMGKGQFKRALEFSQRAVDAAPERFWNQYEYCRALVANDLFDSARRTCAVAKLLLRESKPTQKTAEALQNVLLAREALEQQNRESAIRHAARAVELAPNSGTANLEYCRALTTAGKAAEAQTQCENARIFIALQGGVSGWTLTGIGRVETLDAILLALGSDNVSQRNMRGQ